MPRAEAGTTKAIANKIKSKGLQRLRWYCQACEKQCRDENGFKCHTQSESHVRRLQLIGEDPRKHIAQYTNEFSRTFLQHLKTAHGTKQVNMNHVYQELIQDKTHIHMNATKWRSLTEFAKYLGQEGICRVEETEKGIFVSWIDNSPEALRRQAAVQKQERTERNDEQWEQRIIREQIAKAEEGRKPEGGSNEYTGDLEKQDGQKISLSLGIKKPQSEKTNSPQQTQKDGVTGLEKEDVSADSQTITLPAEDTKHDERDQPNPLKMSLGMNVSSKSKNIFAQKKSNPLAAKRSASVEQPKKISEAERIMREEMERGKMKGLKANPNKRQRIG